MYKSSVINLAFTAALTLGTAVTGNAQFKVVNSNNANRLLPAHIVVADDTSYDGLRHVSNSTVFSSQDRFRLHLQPKLSGNLYILSRDSQGSLHLLYPLREDFGNYVQRNTRIELPASGWFRFDSDTGREELVLIESPVPLNDINENVDNSTLEHYERASDQIVIRHIFLEHQD